MTGSVAGPVRGWSRSHVWGKELAASAVLGAFGCELVCTYQVSWVWVMWLVSGVRFGCVPFSELGVVGSVVCASPPESKDQVHHQTGMSGPNRKTRAGPRFPV